jgi:hypothetical protein
MVEHAAVEDALAADVTDRGLDVGDDDQPSVDGLSIGHLARL